MLSVRPSRVSGFRGRNSPFPPSLTPKATKNSRRKQTNIREYCTMISRNDENTKQINKAQTKSLAYDLLPGNILIITLNCVWTPAADDWISHGAVFTVRQVNTGGENVWLTCWSSDQFPQGLKVTCLEDDVALHVGKFQIVPENWINTNAPGSISEEDTGRGWGLWFIRKCVGTSQNMRLDATPGILISMRVNNMFIIW